MSNRLPAGARAILMAIVEAKTPKQYVRELKRIYRYRYYSLQVRNQAKEILERCGIYL